MYLLNEGGAEDHAASAAEDTLQQYLENDFDPVSCPVCGHYQRYMFPKLYHGASTWIVIAKLIAVVGVCLSALSAAYWGVAYLQRSDGYSLVRLAVTSTLLAVFGLVIFGLGAVEWSQAQRFDPNAEDQRVRIEKGRSRAVTLAELEAQEQERDAETSGHSPKTDSA